MHDKWGELRSQTQQSIERGSFDHRFTDALHAFEGDQWLDAMIYVCGCLKGTALIVEFKAKQIKIYKPIDFGACASFDVLSKRSTADTLVYLKSEDS